MWRWGSWFPVNSCSTSIKYVLLHYFNKLTNKTCMVDIINSEKEFNKIHQKFLITSQNIGIKWKHSDVIKTKHSNNGKNQQQKTNNKYHSKRKNDFN